MKTSKAMMDNIAHVGASLPERQAKLFSESAMALAAAMIDAADHDDTETYALARELLTALEQQAFREAGKVCAAAFLTTTN